MQTRRRRKLAWLQDEPNYRRRRRIKAENVVDTHTLRFGWGGGGKEGGGRLSDVSYGWRAYLCGEKRMRWCIIRCIPRWKEKERELVVVWRLAVGEYTHF